MAELTLPSATSAVGKCTHCGAEIRLDPVWYRALSDLFRAASENKSDIAAIKAFVGMP